MKLVLPWNDEKFGGTEGQKKLVYTNLRRIGLPVEKWKTKPSVQILNALSKVLSGMMTKEWQLVCSNNVEILQSIAEVCPMIYSLSTMDSSIMVDTAKLVERFMADPWNADDLVKADDIAWQARVAQMMCWFNITDIHKDGNKFHYKFSEILLRRKSLGRASIFLALFVSPRGKKFDESSVETIFGRIRASIGDIGAAVIKETADVQYLESEVEEKKPVSFKL